MALVALLYAAYDVSRGLRNGTASVADGNARWLLHAERTLHLDVEHPLNQGLVHAPVLAVIASYFYATLHFIVTPAGLIWLYRRHPLDYGRARSSLAVATVMGLVIFWLVPTTPPRLLTGAGFHDTMAGVSDWGWWGGEGSAPRGLGIAYPILTSLVMMATANHYVFDVVAAAADVALGAGVVIGFRRLQSTRSRSAQRVRDAARAVGARDTADLSAFRSRPVP